MIKKVLEHYEKCLADIKLLNYEEICYYCVMQNIQCGICFYMEQNDMKLDERINRIKYICEIPDNCFNKKDIIITIEFRISYLKSLL